jgi:DNA-binding NarL/FixJ family response regulator
MMFRMSRDGYFLQFKPADGMRPTLPPDELLGRHVHDVLPKRVSDGLLPNIENAVVSRKPQTYTFRLPREDGLHTFESRSVALGNDEVLVIVRDITGDAAPPAETDAKATPNPYKLTKREVDVLNLVAVGITDKQIGKRLAISAETVHKHVAKIRKKMSARSRTEAAVRAIREGLLD